MKPRTMGLDGYSQCLTITMIKAFKLLKRSSTKNKLSNDSLLFNDGKILF